MTTAIIELQKMVDVESVAVFSCEMGEEIENPIPDLVGTLDEDDLVTDAGAEAERIVASMLRDTLGRRYNSDDTKNARNHSFTDAARSASVNLEDEDRTTVELLERVRDGSDIESVGESLSQLYLNEARSVSDLLIYTQFSEYDETFAAILKTPYLEGAHEIDLDHEDTEAVFTENERVIQEETDKSVVYPKYDKYEEHIDEDSAQLYQEGGAQHYAKYWYGFLNLKAAPHPDELVESAIKQRASENETSAAYPTYQDFTDGGPITLDDADGTEADVDQGDVSVRIAGKSIRVSISELRESDNVQLARDGDRFYLLLSDLQPELTVGSGNGKRSLVDDLSNVPDIRDLF